MKRFAIAYGVIGFYLLATTLMMAFDVGFFLLCILTVPICLVMLVCGVVFCVRHWKRYRWKGLLPLLIPVVVAASWLYMPGVIQRYTAEKAAAVRQEAVDLLLKETPEGFSGDVALPEAYRDLSSFGEVRVVRSESGEYVFFQVSRGMTVDSGWYIYATNPAALEAGYDMRHITGNWYRAVKRRQVRRMG